MTGLFDIGMIGLGEMGRNLVLNIADHGFSVAGYDRAAGQVDKLNAGGRSEMQAFRKAKDLTRNLKLPRTIILLVPAGDPVDEAIEDILPGLDEGDLIIDAGNSFYKDTDRRASLVDRKNLLYSGMGISGGGYGARYGASLMFGGPPEAYRRVQPVLEAVSAKVNGSPCTAWLGPGSAGHYVKMVHNGIEYGLLQIISEAYDLLKRSLACSNDEIGQIYQEWNKSDLESYLIESTSKIFLKQDPQSGNPLIDLILDEAGQKGTGKWTSQDAMDLGCPVPTMDAAVAQRELSALKETRVRASRILIEPRHRLTGDRSGIITSLKNALFVSILLTYSQGINLLVSASDRYGYGLHLENVTRIWRGGCIIRSAVLNRIHAEYQKKPAIREVLLDSALSDEILDRQGDLRAIAAAAAALGIPVPAMMSCLSYLDSYRSAWLPAGLIQAQRDFFGAHTYKRIDQSGVFHTEWE